MAKKSAVRKNLILDSGLDNVASFNWTSCIQFCAVGTGNSPTSRTNGAITFTQSGNTLTASGNFFSSADVGRLFKFGTGSGGAEQYITAYTNATTVTVSSSASVGSMVGTVWYVNDTGLQTEVARTNSKSNNSGDNGTTFAANVVTHKVTFLFPAVGSGVTYNEIGWSSGGGATTLFGRDLITPGDTLLTGQVYKIVLQLIVTYSPSSPVASPNVGTGYDSTGTLAIEDISIFTIAGIQSNGAASVDRILDVSANVGAVFFPVSSSQQSSPTNDGSGLRGGNHLSGLGNSGYTNGTFFITKSGNSAVNTLTNTVYGVGIYDGLHGSTTALDVQFTTPVVPSGGGANYTLSTTWTFSWQRVLVN